MAKHKILTEEEIKTELQNLEGWSVRNGEVCTEFAFRDFTQAIDFINKVAVIAEEMDHHPEFCNTYNKVSLSFCTHSVGNKITDTDIKMAEKISAVAGGLMG